MELLRHCVQINSVKHIYIKAKKNPHLQGEDTARSWGGAVPISLEPAIDISPLS